MRKRWVRESVMIEEKGGHVATFDDFVIYVTRESEEQSSLLADAYLRARLRLSRQMLKVVPANSLKVLHLSLVTVFQLIVIWRKHGFGVGSARRRTSIARLPKI